MFLMTVYQYWASFGLFERPTTLQIVPSNFFLNFSKQSLTFSSLLQIAEIGGGQLNSSVMCILDVSPEPIAKINLYFNIPWTELSRNTPVVLSGPYDSHCLV